MQKKKNEIKDDIIMSNKIEIDQKLMMKKRVINMI